VGVKWVCTGAAWRKGQDEHSVEISIVVLTPMSLLVAGALGALHVSEIGAPAPSTSLIKNAVERGGREPYQKICIIVINEAVVFPQVVEP
jgi:hypothetical protein